MQFYGRNGGIRVELGVQDYGPTTFSLRNQSGEDVALLAVGEGPPNISLPHNGSGGESWSVALVGTDPESRETQRCSLLLSEGNQARLIVTLIGEESSPAVMMREGDET